MTKCKLQGHICNAIEQLEQQNHMGEQHQGLLDTSPVFLANWDWNMSTLSVYWCYRNIFNSIMNGHRPERPEQGVNFTSVNHGRKRNFHFLLPLDYRIYFIWSFDYPLVCLKPASCSAVLFLYSFVCTPELLHQEDLNLSEVRRSKCWSCMKLGRADWELS